ncbi:MAG: hypothetical protein WCI51_09200 [Lentisphaerota bacterium]
MKIAAILAGILCVVSVFQINAEVARPQFKSSQLPAIWASVPTSERLKVLRVAQLDAYRALTERVYGFQLTSSSMVYNYMLESDRIRTAIDQEIKGMVEIEQPVYDENGMVTVVYGVKLRKIIETIVTEGGFDKTTVTQTLSAEDKIIEAGGFAALPGTRSWQMLCAKRAAELDAFRLMAERFVGVKISSRTSVADLCLRNDKIHAATIAFLKGLKPVSITYDESLACTVTLQLKIKETVETIESLVKIYNSGAKEKISSVDVSTNDKIFTVEGHGTANNITAGSVNDIYSAEKVVLSQVITKSVVIE